MFAAAIRVNRSVESYVRRTVPGQDRLGVLNSHARAARGHSIQRLDLIEPFTFQLTIVKIETRGSRIAGCSTASVRFDGHGQWDTSTKRTKQEHTDELAMAVALNLRRNPVRLSRRRDETT